MLWKTVNGGSIQKGNNNDDCGQCVNAKEVPVDNFPVYLVHPFTLCFSTKDQ